MFRIKLSEVKSSKKIENIGSASFEEIRKAFAAPKTEIERLMSELQRLEEEERDAMNTHMQTLQQ